MPRCGFGTHYLEYQKYLVLELEDGRVLLFTAGDGSNSGNRMRLEADEPAACPVGGFIAPQSSPPAAGDGDSGEWGVAATGWMWRKRARTRVPEAAAVAGQRRLAGRLLCACATVPHCL
jgi:hypothetical protein